MPDLRSELSPEALSLAWRRDRDAHCRWLTSGCHASAALQPFVSRETESTPQLKPIPMEWLNVEPSETCFQRLADFAALVLEANQRLNLVSRRDPVAQIRTNILDSIPLSLLWAHVSRETEHYEAPNFLLDAGSGSGVPGIPLQLILDEMAGPTPALLLVESRGRKADFLERCLGSLSMEKAAVWAGRLEDVELSAWLEDSGWPSPGLLMTRGLTDVAKTLQWTRRLVQGDWVSSFLLVKGAPGMGREWRETGSRWGRSGWSIPNLHLFVPGEREYCLLEGRREQD